MNNKLKLIGYYIKLIILSLLIFLFVILNIINNTYLNEKYHLNKMNKNYYNRLDKEIYDSIKINTMASNFDEKIINDFYTKEDIKNDVLEYMDYIFNKSDNKLDLTNIENKISISVNKYIEDNNIVNTTDENISLYIKTVLDIYEEKITVMHITDILRNRIIKLKKLVNIAIIILSILILVLILIVRKNLKLYLFIPFNVLGDLFIFIALMLKYYIDIRNLLLITYSISDYIRLLLNSTIKFLLVSGSITLLVSIVINIILVLKNQNNWDILENNS